VKRGTVYAPQEFNEYYKKGKATGKELGISVSNMYFKTDRIYKISQVTTEKNFKTLIGKGSYDEHTMDVYINPDDFRALFDGGIYQISVMADDSHNVDTISDELRGMGMRVLPLKDAIVEEENAEGILSVLQVPLLIILVVVIFFITYFVTRLIIKSRDKYFSIVRMLGMSRRDVKRILDIEMLIVITIAFALFVLLCLLVANGVIKIAYLQYLLDYLSVKEFVGLYIALAIMSYLISSRAARKLFRASAMETYRGEA
jgi:ABC-type antimicrobial peptide transport system permease subunit